MEKLRNGELALRFLDHLSAVGLSTARVAKYASHLPVILRFICVNLSDIKKTDIENVVATINSAPHKEWTKHDKKLTLKKFIQYAKFGSCTKGTPWTAEVDW